MPFTPKEFAARHNKKLSGRAAKKASEVANAMIKRGADEGIAIATANKQGNKMQGKNPLHDHPRSRRE